MIFQWIHRRLYLGDGRTAFRTLNAIFQVGFVATMVAVEMYFQVERGQVVPWKIFVVAALSSGVAFLGAVIFWYVLVRPSRNRDTVARR